MNHACAGMKSRGRAEHLGALDWHWIGCFGHMEASLCCV